METETLKWKKRFERERAARKEAERLLEEKSAELYELNLSLENKVALEVKKNAQKEKIIFQQSKMASMGEMISNIAHQWRQPLQAIALLTQNLQIIKLVKNRITDEDIEEMSEKVNEQLEFLTNTIEDFRGFFRPNKDKTDFDVKKALNKALSIINSTIKKNSITLIKDIDNIMINNLENELIQVIMNLLKNAIDVLSEKTIEHKLIKLSAKIEDDNLVIKVIDNAGGVPESIKDKIFEPYFTTKHKSQGTGLGLYMSLTIIENHMNGKLYVENVEFEHENKKYIGAAFMVVFQGFTLNN